jgi:GntR family transcriptional regulator
MKGPLSPPAFRPLYQQIKLLVTRSLSAGDWRPGEAIPSETELAARFGVSQGTVRKAVNELADENLLVRHQGKGTFVASHATADRRYHFTRMYPDRGERELPVPEVLEWRRVRADARTARTLALAPGASLILIRRRLSVGGRPVELDEARIPAALFKGFTPAALSAQEGMLYSSYERLFGVRIVKAREQLKAVAADAEAASLLAVAPGSPLLQVDRVASTYDDRAVELRRMLYRTADFHYRTDLV